MLLKVYWY